MTAANKPHDQPIPVAEVQALSAFLTAKGLPSALVAAALGTTPGSGTRLEYSQSLIAVFRTLSKG
jgi:hypothetical protein